MSTLHNCYAMIIIMEWIISLIVFVANRIHFGISYKAAVRTLVRTYRRKYLSLAVFKATFDAVRDFHIVLVHPSRQSARSSTMGVYENTTDRHRAP